MKRDVWIDIESSEDQRTSVLGILARIPSGRVMVRLVLDGNRIGVADTSPRWVELGDVPRVRVRDLRSGLRRNDGAVMCHARLAPDGTLAVNVVGLLDGYGM